MDFKLWITTGIKVDLFNEMYIHTFQSILEAILWLSGAPGELKRTSVNDAILKMRDYILIHKHLLFLSPWDTVYVMVSTFLDLEKNESGELVVNVFFPLLMIPSR